MKKRKLTRKTLAALEESGLHISSLYQRPSEGRVAQPGDPWTAQLFYPEVVIGGWPVSWYASFVSWADGSSADDAIMAAIQKSQGLEGAYRKLGGAMAHLTEILHVARTGRSYA